MIKNRINTASLIASALLVLFTLYLVTINYLSGPYKDDWDLIPLLEQTLAGPLSFPQLWEPYAGIHRIVLTKLLFIIDYRLFNGTNIVQTTASIILQGLTLVLWMHAIRSYPATTSKKSIAMLTASMFLFHSAQVFNITYAFDSQWFISTSACVAALFFYRTREASALNNIVIIGLGIIASLGNTAGWMIWPSLLVCSLLMSTKKMESLLWFSMLILMTLIWGSGVHQVAPPPNLPPWHQWVPAWLAQMAIFLARLIGNPWTSFNNNAGILLGFIGLSALGYCLLRHRHQPHTFFLSIALYACMIAMAITLGRSGYEQEAATPRFYTVTLLFWGGLLCHILLLQKTRPYAYTAGVLACLIALPLYARHAQDNIAMTENARHSQFALMIGMHDWDAIKFTLAWYMPANNHNPGKEHEVFLKQRRLGYYQLPQARFIDTTLTLPLQTCGAMNGEIFPLQLPGEYNVFFRQPLQQGLWLTTDAHGTVNGALRQYRPIGWLLPMRWLPDDRPSWSGYAHSTPAWAVRIEDQHATCRLPLQPSTP
ncbi:MAG TPA: hypothetical protein VIM96_07090 [Pseudomonadales bacterium]